MKNLAWVLVLLLLVVAAVWALANFAFAQTKVETATVFGTVREVVVKADRGDVDVVPAPSSSRLRETRHWVVSQPELEQTRRNGVLTIQSTCSRRAGRPEVLLGPARRRAARRAGHRRRRFG